ncbi:MAG: carboxypeptidase regulatory-like domain-containing protein, partial [Gemmatimonadetes bacterium]|nr:carboxypeptidase regulatory-like domain-containing protein [Gemmatimonadota bacterium]
LHPALEALGLEPIVRAVTVAGEDVRTDLAIPSAERLRAAYCGGQPGAVVIGFVRAASGGAPVEGATVAGEWLELAIGNRRIAQQTARREVKTGANGGYLLCDVPSAGTVLLTVTRGAESTDRIETEIPARGFVRRDLFLGAGDPMARRDTARGDSVPPGPRTGPGRLTGTVLAADGGRPLAGAQVSVVGGQPTRADPGGAWTLTGAPAGTRLIEVRAPGYYAVRRAVDIADEARPVSVTLSRLSVMLDTIRATARPRARLAMAGFNERRQSSGAGRFYTEWDIEKRRVFETSELFNYIPGLSRDRGADGEDVISMRGAFGRCAPAVYLDGHRMENLTARDVDSLIPPDQIAAVEVYTSAVPPQFQGGMTGCGSIVFWTK